MTAKALNSTSSAERLPTRKFARYLRLGNVRDATRKGAAYVLKQNLVRNGAAMLRRSDQTSRRALGATSLPGDNR